MPLERKILLVILGILILFFGSWFYYTELYIPNKDTLSKINRLESYILKWNESEQSKIPENFEQVIDRAEELNGFFSTKETFSMDQFAGDIRATLTTNSVNITQFRTGQNSVTFYISGERKDLLKAIWELSNAKPLYYFDTLQLRVDKERMLQGVITLSPLFYPIEVNENYWKEDIRGENFRGFYKKNLADIWGEPLPQIEEIIEVQEPEIVEEPVYNTDKFTYIGTMKGGEGITYMFRETTNGRVFIYSLGETISEWTLEELKDGTFIFKNQDRLYEVKE